MIRFEYPMIHFTLLIIDYRQNASFRPTRRIKDGFKAKQRVVIISINLRNQRAPEGRFYKKNLLPRLNVLSMYTVDKFASESRRFSSFPTLMNRETYIFQLFLISPRKRRRRFYTIYLSQLLLGLLLPTYRGKRAFRTTCVHTCTC